VEFEWALSLAVSGATTGNISPALFVDNVYVPNSRRTFYLGGSYPASFSNTQTLYGVVPNVAAGNHTIAMKYDYTTIGGSTSGYHLSATLMGSAAAATGTTASSAAVRAVGDG
jgi:hypothetical protein